jgi:hypothetical protein
MEQQKKCFLFLKNVQINLEIYGILEKATFLE